MRLVVCVVVMLGCGDDGGGSAPDSATPDSATPDAGNVDAMPPAATGTIAVPACVGLAGIDEGCTVVTNGDACGGAPCEKLMVLFSGGESGCTTQGYGAVLAGYAAAGWAAVCIDAFETADGSVAVPYLTEAPRYEAAFDAVVAWGQTYWTGAQLLLEGISHGASAPLIAIARTDVDTRWRGTTKTAACMLDGTYNQYATMDFLRSNGCLAPVSFRRWLTRYCGPDATIANCDLQTQPDAVQDTIVAAPAAGFDLDHLRLVECGSATAACNSDIIPAAPIQALCDHLGCDFVSDPTTSHIGCLGAHFDGCRTWFDSL